MKSRFHTICWLALGWALPAAAQQPAAGPPWTWDTLEARLEAAAADGFCGVVHAVRAGEVALSRGYGLADHARGTPLAPDTVFAIGSTPIDFTRAAVLLLHQERKLRLDEALPAFFDPVPEDKRAITLAQLLSGASGLADFHDLPSDRDPDHAWIDRAEAIRRILAQELRFAPGTARAHSHSAWTLLAAVVELRSGQSYPEFTRTRLFRPAGMTDTGFFGEPIDPERLAIGYGARRDGTVNAPPYWGPTSWLVMGSGGMVSTVLDMARWVEALRSQRLLSAEAMAAHWPPGGLLAGGDMYGFEILYTDHPGSYAIVCSNAVDAGSRPRFQAVAEGIVAMALRDGLPPFTLGVELAVEDAQVLVAGLLPGGAAERAGLRPGDVLLSAGGRPLLPEPLAALRPYLESGTPVAIRLTRAGQALELQVTPQARAGGGSGAVK